MEENVQWMEVKIELPDRLKEAVANYLVELGATGVWEQDGYPSMVSAYFSKSESSEATKKLNLYIGSLREMYPRLPSVHVELKSVEGQDWGEKWKDFFHAQPFGKSFFLQPSWQKTEKIPEGRIPILMDPGMAFGTGLHESTQLAVMLMEELLGNASSDSVLDVGTGSGILAIVARKLGVESITAIDNDEIAVEVARENCSRNGCASVVTKHATAESCDGEFDFVVANILLETHLASLDAYSSRLQSKGTLILSGLLVSQENAIRDALGKAGFQVSATRNHGEWFACAAHR